MRISKSKINTYKKCPREFKYIYVDNFESEPNEYMQLGLDIHSIAENVGAELSLKDAVTDDDIIEAFEKHFIESEFDITKHMENLFFFFKDILNSGYKIFNVEEDIYDNEYDIRGIVDLVLEDEDGDLIVIDYKTGKSKPITDYRLELCMYRRLIEFKYPGRTVSSAAIFFTKDGKYRGLNFTDEQKKGSYITEEDYKAVFKYINFIRDKIDNNIFPPKKQFLCEYCNFQEQCNSDGGF